MLHQKLFFKDLLDHASSKSKISKNFDVKMLSRLAEMSKDHKAGNISISASLKLNDQLNPNISGEINANMN